MRRWVSGFMVILLACLLVLPVAAADPGSDANPANTDPQADDPGAPPPALPTIHVPDGSLVFGTPDGWTMDNTQSQFPVLATVFGPSAGLRLQVAAYPQGNSLDDEISGFKAYVASSLSGISNEVTQDRMIGNELAKTYSFSATRSDGSPISGNFTVVFHSGQEYTFITLADAAPLPNTNDVDVLLGSVGFLS